MFTLSSLSSLFLSCFLFTGMGWVASPTLAMKPQAFGSKDLEELNKANFFDGYYDQSSSTKFQTNQFIVAQENTILNQNNSIEDYIYLINQINDPQVKGEMLLNLSKKYFKSEKLELALETLNQALEVTKTVENNSSKVWLITKIAAIYIENKDLETALNILDNALEISKEVTSQAIQGSLLIDLANKYQQIGKSEQAQIILAEVKTIIAAIENPPSSFPFQPLPFTAKTRFGTNFFSSKDTNANFTIGVDASKRWETEEIDIDFQFLNSYDDSRDSNEKNRVVLDLVTEYKYYFNEPTYFFGNVAYLQDDFSSNESKVSYFTGVGFNLWQGSNSDEMLNMQLGIGDLFQNNTIRNRNAPFPVFQYTVSFKNVFLTDWKFEQYFILEVPVINTANYFGDSRTVLKIPAINNWSIFSDLTFRYFGISEFQEPNLSTRFIGGIEYEF